MTGLSHLDSTKDRLVIAWNEFSPKHSQRLDRKTAIRELRDDSRRPVLLLRDSDPKDKKLADLVCRSFSNEKVQLASHWFRCVKVGDEVLEPKHPLNVLFADKVPPRVILASYDGSRVVRALGSSWERLDWGDLCKVLQVDYKKSPTQHVSQLIKALVAIDKLDEKHKAISRQMQEAESKGSPTGYKRLRKKLRKAEADFKKALAREKKYKDLGLRNPPAAKKTKKTSKSGN